MNATAAWTILITVVLLIIVLRLVPEENRSCAGCGCLVIAGAVIAAGFIFLF